MQVSGSLKLIMALLGSSWPFLGPIWSQSDPQFVSPFLYLPFPLEWGAPLSYTLVLCENIDIVSKLE
jgi:hypothetical protein